MTPCSAPPSMCCASSCAMSPFPSASACRCARSGTCRAASSVAPASRPSGWSRTNAFAPPTIFCCCAPKPVRPIRPWPSGGRVSSRWTRTNGVSWLRSFPRRHPVGVNGDAAVASADRPRRQRRGMSEPVENSVCAYIGLGSNLADPVAQVRAGVAALTSLDQTRVELCSSFYRTAPVGLREQPDFINAGCRVRTRQEPAMLMRNLLEIERAHGRTREGGQGGPRTLDLDLLLYADRQIRTAD